MQIELTSVQEGKWTWRKAGAKHPKGEMDAALLPKGAALGDEIWVEVISGLDGIFVETVLPTKTETDSKSAVQTLEVLGSKRKFKPVTSNVTGPKAKKPRQQKKPRFRRELEPKPDSKVEKRGPGPKLNAKTIHADTWYKELPEEQKPIAKKIIAGGMPAVRKALAKENLEPAKKSEPGEQNGLKPKPENPKKSTAEAVSPKSKSLPVGQELVALAQKLDTAYRLAHWEDRVEAAINGIDTVRLSDLRAVLASAEGLKRNKGAAAKAEELHQKLMERLENETSIWIEDITILISEDRILRAINMSSRPPKAGSPLPEDISLQLAQKAGAALKSETSSKRWTGFLEACYLSPIAKMVVPVSYPTTVSEELLKMAERAKNTMQEVSSNLITISENSSKPPRMAETSGTVTDR